MKCNSLYLEGGRMAVAFSRKEFLYKRKIDMNDHSVADKDSKSNNVFVRKQQYMHFFRGLAQMSTMWKHSPEVYYGLLRKWSYGLRNLPKTSQK